MELTVPAWNTGRRDAVPYRWRGLFHFFLTAPANAIPTTGGGTTREPPNRASTVRGTPFRTPTPTARANGIILSN